MLRGSVFPCAGLFFVIWSMINVFDFLSSVRLWNIKQLVFLIVSHWSFVYSFNLSLSSACFWLIRWLVVNFLIFKIKSSWFCLSWYTFYQVHFFERFRCVQIAGHYLYVKYMFVAIGFWSINLIRSKYNSEVVEIRHPFF